MGNLFEVRNDSGKISVTDNTPCVYFIEKRKISSYDDRYDIASNHIDLDYRNVSGRIYYLGFDVNQLSNGSFCIDTSVTSGLHNFATISIYGDYNRVKDVDLYFFGIKKKTTASNAGLELYDEDGYVLFTSRSGTKYPKVLMASTATTSTFTISANPQIFVVNGWDVLGGSSWSRRRLPWITKSGTSVTVKKDYAGGNFPWVGNQNLYLYSWMVVSLQTVQ